MSNDIFTKNPTVKEAFITSDGEPFYTKNAAENHAKTLKVKTITHKVNPSEKVAVVEEDNQVLVQTGENADGSAILENKLTAKQQLQKDYTDKFGEVPAEEFTKAQLAEAIEKNEKLVAEIKND